MSVLTGVIQVGYSEPDTGKLAVQLAQALNQYRFGSKFQTADSAQIPQESSCAGLKLRNWILKLRPAQLAWFAGDIPDVEEVARTAEREAAERRMADTIAELMKCEKAARRHGAEIVMFRCR